MQNCMYNFEKKFFFAKSTKLEKGNLNVFAHISGLRLDTKMYCIAFESLKSKNQSIFHAFFAKITMRATMEQNLCDSL